jgi:hypothetical protein
MDKRIAGLLGAAAALSAVNAAQAATPTQDAGLAPAASYRQLLDPIANAMAELQADNTKQTGASATGETRLAYHHHHHHHRWWRRRHHHHHHHHHHHY